MTTTRTTHRPGTRVAIDEWASRVDAMLAAADDAASTVPFVTFPRDRFAGIVRHA